MESFDDKKLLTTIHFFLSSKIVINHETPIEMYYNVPNKSFNYVVNFHPQLRINNCIHVRFGQRTQPRDRKNPRKEAGKIRVLRIYTNATASVGQWVFTWKYVNYADKKFKSCVKTYKNLEVIRKTEQVEMSCHRHFWGKLRLRLNARHFCSETTAEGS